MHTIGAVILAAGESSRFGRPKQTVQIGGKSLVRRIVEAAIEAKCSPAVAVVGHAYQVIRRELTSTATIIVKNKNWRRGLGSSIRVGMEAVMTHCISEQPRDTARSMNRWKPPLLEGVILLLCDQPFVEAHTITKLIAINAKTKKPIVACAYANTLGVPALFDRSCFDELVVLKDTSGAKPIILRDRSRVAEFPFPQGEIDIDNLNDYENFAQRCS